MRSLWYLFLVKIYHKFDHGSIAFGQIDLRVWDWAINKYPNDTAETFYKKLFMKVGGTK